MAGTAAASVKKALFDALKAQSGQGQPLDGVQVSYSFPGNPERACLFLGRARFNHELSTFMAGGRLPRTETLTVTVVIYARDIGSDQYAADSRAVAIGTVLEDLLATDPTAGGAVLIRRVESGELEPLVDDDGVIASLSYSVTVESELT
ncbi:hypothetical protein NQK81_13300 [Amycolatopsis roodepoortensis]|uniref:hypothetical protein n=1 Tax=Amycolatopsis roodepoortensis TaxID=700274 RepID=UPI00214B5B22|nr:hypothetical protein [Amycolatopsis roodepoortensis]UUV34381.1 hypothetical protein NQK81_13300 [Amycolatopsis roodepoortensis]